MRLTEMICGFVIRQFLPLLTRENRPIEFSFLLISLHQLMPVPAHLLYIYSPFVLPLSLAVSGFPSFAILFCCFTAVGVVGYVVDTHRLSLGVGVDCLGRFPAVIVSPSSCPATTSGRPSQKSFPKINARVVRIGANAWWRWPFVARWTGTVDFCWVCSHWTDRPVNRHRRRTHRRDFDSTIWFPPHMLSLHHPFCYKEHKDSYSYLVLFFSFLSYLSVERS